MLYVFLMKPYKRWKFEKLHITLLAKFLHKKTVVFQWKHFIFKFSLDFYSASFPNLKASKGCLEKNENLTKRFGL